MREEKSVAALPLGIVGPKVQRVPVGHGEDLGHAERLADVTLSLHFAHPQRVPTDAVGAIGKCGKLVRHLSSFDSQCHEARSGQWISIPPFTSSVTPVR